MFPVEGGFWGRLRARRDCETVEQRLRGVHGEAMWRRERKKRIYQGQARGRRRLLLRGCRLPGFGWKLLHVCEPLASGELWETCSQHSFWPGEPLNGFLLGRWRAAALLWVPLRRALNAVRFGGDRGPHTCWRGFVVTSDVLPRTYMARAAVCSAGIAALALTGNLSSVM